MIKIDTNSIKPQEEINNNMNNIKTIQSLAKLNKSRSNSIISDYSYELFQQDNEYSFDLYNLEDLYKIDITNNDIKFDETILECNNDILFQIPNKVKHEKKQDTYYEWMKSRLSNSISDIEEDLSKLPSQHNCFKSVNDNNNDEDY